MNLETLPAAAIAPDTSDEYYRNAVGLLDVLDSTLPVMLGAIEAGGALPADAPATMDATASLMQDVEALLLAHGSPLPRCGIGHGTTRPTRSGR